MNIILLKSHEIQFQNLNLTFLFSEQKKVRHLQTLTLQNLDIVNGLKQTAKCQYNVINISSLSYSPILPFRTIILVHCTRVCMQMVYKEVFSEHWFRMFALHSFGRIFQYSCLENHKIVATSCILFCLFHLVRRKQSVQFVPIRLCPDSSHKKPSSPKTTRSSDVLSGSQFETERGCHSLGIRFGCILRIRAIRVRVHSQISCEFM